MLIEKPFYFLRHGLTDWNKEKRYQGQRDIPLNDEGIQQAYQAQALLKNEDITAIYTSTLSRAKKTAEIINEVHKVSLLESLALQECHYGSLEGQLKTDPRVDANWRKGVTPKGAEDYHSFSDRVLNAVNDILNSSNLPLIVAHRAVYWPISEAANIGYDIDLGNACPLLMHPPAAGNANWRTEFIRA
ncbi:histidine phosphatase family protein [uncultured Kiloniella sp.]|uniref:histidine phosphatase family protein n=1 Tax=uncultured Kiloniella sp. TaxID=1133091 RepID=UPI00261272E3|nr:histidine phosphatase family protein [uncultured Kiloniella sp.]